MSAQAMRLVALEAGVNAFLASPLGVAVGEVLQASHWVSRVYRQTFCRRIAPKPDVKQRASGSLTK